MKEASGRKRNKEWGGEQMHKALTLSPYYQLALQAGWGCHGDAEGCNGSRAMSRVAREHPTQSRSRSVTSARQELCVSVFTSK